MLIRSSLVAATGRHRVNGANTQLSAPAATGVSSSRREEILSSHIRSLMPGHLVDVASNDQHNVKPWFNGRVNLSPPVPRLDSDSSASTR